MSSEPVPVRYVKVYWVDLGAMVARCPMQLCPRSGTSWLLSYRCGNEAIVRLLVVTFCTSLLVGQCGNFVNSSGSTLSVQSDCVSYTRRLWSSVGLSSGLRLLRSQTQIHVVQEELLIISRLWSFKAEGGGGLQEGRINRK